MRQIAVKGAIIHPEGSDRLAVDVRIDVVRVREVFYTVDIPPIPVHRMAQVTENVIKGAVLHDHDHDRIYVRFELRPRHLGASGRHSVTTSMTRMGGTVAHVSSGPSGAVRNQSPASGDLANALTTVPGDTAARMPACSTS